MMMKNLFSKKKTHPLLRLWLYSRHHLIFHNFIRLFWHIKDITHYQNFKEVLILQSSCLFHKTTCRSPTESPSGVTLTL
jgi:hypothetical protein